MMRHEPDTTKIYDLLYRLGLAATSTAFFHLAYTVRLAAYQPQRLLALSGDSPALSGQSENCRAEYPVP